MGDRDTLFLDGRRRLRRRGSLRTQRFGSKTVTTRWLRTLWGTRLFPGTLRNF